MDRMSKKQGSFKEYGNQKNTQNQKELVEISWTRNEEGGLGKLNTHMA